MPAWRNWQTPATQNRVSLADVWVRLPPLAQKSSPLRAPTRARFQLQIMADNPQLRKDLTSEAADQGGGVIGWRGLSLPRPSHQGERPTDDWR